jgi:hypothetical protein
MYRIELYEVSVGINYLTDTMDEKAVQDYCRCSEDKKKPIGEEELKTDKELLDFRVLTFQYSYLFLKMFICWIYRYICALFC